MSNSPITKRVQTALYMKASALKQSKEDENKETEVMNDMRGGRNVVVDATTETIQNPDVTSEVSESLGNTYTGDDFYQGDYYAPDSPLGKEMAAMGLSNSPDEIREYEKSKMIKNRQRGNTVAFSQVQATDTEGNVRDVSDDELKKMSDDQIMSRQNVKQITTPGSTEKKTKITDKESTYGRLAPWQVRQATRAKKLAMKGEQKLKRKARRMLKKDPTNQNAKNILDDMNYETAGNIYQGGASHTKTYTNVGDDTFKSRNQLTDEETPNKMKTTPLKQGKKKAVSKIASKVSKKIDDAKKVKTTTKAPVSKVDPKAPVAKKPVAKKPVAKKPVAKKPVAKKPAPKTPPAKPPVKRGRPVGSKNKPKATPTTGKKTTTPPKKSFGQRVVGGAKTVGKYGLAAGAGAFVNSMFSSDDSPAPVTPGPGPGPGPGPITPPVKPDPVKPDPVKPTPVTPGGGGSGDKDYGTIEGGGKVTPVDYNKSSVTGQLSESMQKFNRRQDRKDQRATARQGRQDRRLDSRLKRKEQRQSARIAGKAMSFSSGKKYDSSINNMGSIKKSPSKMNAPFKMGGYGSKANKK